MPSIGVGLGEKWRINLKKVKFSNDPKSNRLCYEMTRDYIATIVVGAGPPMISRVEFGLLTKHLDCVFLNNQPHIFIVRRDLYLYLVPKTSN